MKFKESQRLSSTFFWSSLKLNSFTGDGFKNFATKWPFSGSTEVFSSGKKYWDGAYTSKICELSLSLMVEAVPYLLFTFKEQESSDWSKFTKEASISKTYSDKIRLGFLSLLFTNGVNWSSICYKIGSTYFWSWISVCYYKALTSSKSLRFSYS